MKRCKRCYSVIEKKSSHCPSCGIEVNFKNTYHTNENKVIGATSKVNNDKKTAKIAIVFFVCFYAFAFCVGIFTSIKEDIVEKAPTNTTFDVTTVDDYLYNTKLIAEDYYAIWTYALTGKVTKDIIVEKTSLSLESLTNSYCKNLDINPTIENSIKCVKTAHIMNGTHEAAYDDLEYIYDALVDWDYYDINYDIMNEIYMYGVNLYGATTEEVDYDKFESDYNTAIMKLESLVEELEDEAL